MHNTLRQEKSVLNKRQGEDEFLDCHNYAKWILNFHETCAKLGISSPVLPGKLTSPYLVTETPMGFVKNGPIKIAVYTAICGEDTACRRSRKLIISWSVPCMIRVCGTNRRNYRIWRILTRANCCAANKLPKEGKLQLQSVVIRISRSSGFCFRLLCSMVL